jgi:hypothetical protein
MEANLDYREQAAKCTKVAYETHAPELRALLLATMALSCGKSGSISSPASADRGSGAGKADKGRSDLT